MTTTEVVPKVAPEAEQEKTFELGTWLGRRQAFGLMASRCTAADVECLKVIREQKLYKSRAASWDEFCERYVGFGRAYADRLIQNLEEFGVNYFHISQMLRISAEKYRAIAGAVMEDAIEFNGEKIPISPEHSQRIADAVTSLLKAAEQASDKPKKAGAKRDSVPPPAPPTPRQRMDQLRQQISHFAAEFSAVAHESLDLYEQARLSALLEESRNRLFLLEYSLPKPG